MNKQDFYKRFPALESRDFALFWGGQLISLIGTWMQNTTLPYLAYRISHNPFDLGLIGFATTLPTFVLALPGGVLVERLDKRKTVITLQGVMMLQALAMGLLALNGQIQIWHIALLSLLLGTASAIEITARQSMLVELVGKERLPNAIALQATVFNTARVIGPSLAAPFLIFLGESGEGWAFLANAVSYLFVVLGLLFVRTPFRAAPNPNKKDGKGEFKEGMGYIFSTPLISMIILMASVIGFVGFPLLQQIPVISRDILAQAGDTEAAQAARNGLLYTAQGIGALSAALLLAAFNPARKGWLLLAGQIVFALSLMAVSLSRNIPLSVILIVLVGWGTVTTLATMNTLIQVQTPNSLRGRVFSAYLWGLQGVAPFGSLLIGWLAQNWGVPQILWWGGLFCLVSVGVVHLFQPQIRQQTG